MAENKKHIVKSKDFLFGTDDSDALLLDCGKKLHSVNIRYETYGKLNANGSNAILIFHALTGDAHVSGWHSEEDRKPGWWNDMIGPGKPIDTEKYFVVCSNVIGGCSGSTGPRSINLATGKLYNMDFPVITIADMVRAQRRLMKHLKVEKWLSIIGGSMGGMQALEWSISYPELTESIIPIATTARLSPQSIAFDWVGREAILTDKNWDNGDYTENIPENGLATARMLAHITYLSDESMRRKFGRNLQESESYSFDFKRDFAVESYLQYQGQRFVERFDANCYLYITRAMDYFDVSAKAGGNLAAAFKNVTCPFLVISFSSDWLFPTAQSVDLVKALLKNRIDVSYCEIESSYGHDAFLLEIEVLGKMISDFLRNRLEVIDGK
ncbi:MAG: homoserine O-acetyltransferase [Lentisphaerae bacterium]|nr:homoserine O-acetyltransferase [Lentisphaerota bacterium]MCP4101213.1 homoserine O-acetyltransferase [Lentisphaerota bacterium]